MDDTSKLDRTVRRVPPRPPRPSSAPRRTDARDAAPDGPVNPWLLIGAGVLVVLLIVLFA